MFFPLFVDLSEKEILVVGAGTIASRRVRILCDFSKHLTVVAPGISPEIGELISLYGFQVEKRQFQEKDLEGKDLVLAATDDAELNREIAAMCRARRIPVNDSSEQSFCDFQFPSIVQSGDVVVGVNASGKNHRLVKETREKIEQCLKVPQGFSNYK